MINNPPDYLLKNWEWKENDLPEIHVVGIRPKENTEMITSSEIILKLWESIS